MAENRLKIFPIREPAGTEKPPRCPEGQIWDAGEQRCVPFGKKPNEETLGLLQRAFGFAGEVSDWFQTQVFEPAGAVLTSPFRGLEAVKGIFRPKASPFEFALEVEKYKKWTPPKIPESVPLVGGRTWPIKGVAEFAPWLLTGGFSLVGLEQRLLQASLREGMKQGTKAATKRILYDAASLLTLPVASLERVAIGATELALRNIIGRPLSFIGGKLTRKGIPKTGMTELDSVLAMWKPGKPSGVPFTEKVQEFRRSFEEAFMDKFAGVNKLTSSARKGYGGKIPIELDAELQAANLAGAGDAGAQLATDTFRNMKWRLGKNIREEYVDTYLSARHAVDITKLKGSERIAVGSIKGVAGAEDVIAQLRKVLGEEKFKRVVAAAEVVKDHYALLLERKVVSGLVSRPMATHLREIYPWYNPTKYLEFLATYGESGGKIISVTSSGLRRMGDIGLETARMRPLDTLAQATVATETLIRRNNAARAMVRLAEKDPQMAGQVGKVKGLMPAGAKLKEVPAVTLKQARARLGEMGIQDDEYAALQKLVREAEAKGLKDSDVIQEATTETVKAFIRRPGEIRGTISFMENGERVIYEVPGWLEREAKSLTSLSRTFLEKFGAVANALSRFGMTTANLAFFIPNFAVDALTAMITHGVGPVHLSKRLLRGLAGIAKEDPVLAQLRRSGGSMSGFWGKTPEQIARDVEHRGQLVLKDRWDWKRVLGLPVEAITKIGHAVEMTPRTAIFETSLKRGELLERAALLARRGTIDFQRAGYAARQANALFLYLNAGIQGSLIPFRALRDFPRSRYWLTGYMGLTTGTYAWNRQFPEYDDVPDYAKYGAHVVMLPSEEYDARGNKVPHYVTIVPNLREWSLFSGTLTYMLRRLDQRAPEDTTMFLNTLVRQLNPISQITGESGIPVPTQPGATMVELALNRDTFRNRDIIPEELKGLPTKEQYNRYTSEIAKRAGGHLGISPLKLDYFVKNIFGGLGEQVISAMDAVAQKISPTPENQRQIELQAKLQEITPPEVSPEEMTLKRNEFLFSLSVADRKAVLELDRQPQMNIPIITPIAKRIYRTSGGQLYKTGHALAEKETGISRDQTTKTSRVLSEFSDELQEGQELIDISFAKQLISGTEWRANHNDSGAYYRGALLAVGVMYPNAVQSKNAAERKEYYDKVYTLASAMPDQRSRGELLLASYRAIEPQEIVPGKMNWDTFFQIRDEFKSGLIPEDKELLERLLDVRMTVVEKEYDKAIESLREYWAITDRLYKLFPMAKKIDAILDNPAKSWIVKQGFASSPVYNQFVTVRSDMRKMLRMMRPEVDIALYIFFNEFDNIKPLTPDAVQLIHAFYGRVNDGVDKRMIAETE